MGSRLGRHSSLEGAARGGGGSGLAPPSLSPRSRTEEAPRRRRSPDRPLASRLLGGAGKRAGGLRQSSPGGSAGAAPYVRRVAWLREIQGSLRQPRQREPALRLLRLLRQDLGLEGTSLSEVLYKNPVGCLNPVDPISHDLLLNLARDLQCPKKDCDPWKSSDRICRQLIYHLSPHLKGRSHGLSRRKSQGSLKHSLQKTTLTQEGSVDLSGVPLSLRDVHRLAYYLQNHGSRLASVDLSFAELTDETLRPLLPFLWRLPSLAHLSLQGNRLTRATLKELTDTMKDPRKFPHLAWVDLGNNVDISCLPQPLLVGLRRRLSHQTSLPTIYESTDCDSDRSSGGAPSSPEEGARLVARDDGSSCFSPQQSRHT